MPASADRLIQRGHAALVGGDAGAAREAFEQALQAAVTGEALSGLAEAVHLDGDYDGARRLFERAFSAFVVDGQPLAATRVARTLAYQCHLDGDWAAMNGWLGRARRLLADIDGGVEHQWIKLFDAMGEPDPDRREHQLLEIIDAARRLRDTNLECDALGVLGEHCVQIGRVQEGMALLDEALIPVCTGAVGEFVVVEGAFCLMLSACETTLDVARAERWVRTGDDVMASRGLSTLGPLCRGYYGGVLIAAGRYAEAEETLSRSAHDLARGYAHARNAALARLADVRVRQGRLEEAEQLLKGIEEHPDAAHPFAALHLALGRTALARDRIGRALATAVGIPLVRLLALLVEVQLAEGAVQEAQETAARLATLQEGHPSAYVAAAVALARGQVCVASGQGDGPTCLREALARFAEAQMPLEVARSRLELARAMAAEGPEVAVAEATAALEAFEDLPAARLVDAAAALLRELGSPVRVGPKGVGALTKREAEVLTLVSHGLSNPEIAERLVISRKTVEHHVGRILMRLGLRNRAQAAALVARSGEIG